MATQSPFSNYSFSGSLKTLIDPFASLLKKPAVGATTPTSLFTPAPAPTKPAVPSLNYTPVPPPKPTGGAYTVKSGDTLSAIASRSGMTLQNLIALNPQFASNPNLIRVGQSVNLAPGAIAKPVTPAGGPAGAPGGTFNVQPIPQVQNQPQTPPPGPQGSQNPAPGATSAPVVPSISPETQKAYDSANKAYEESLKISPEELSTQEDLDKLIESTKSAYRSTSGQAIPLEFITGQLSAIEKRATGLAEPLERKLGRLQAARQSSLEASKFALERAEKKVSEEKSLTAPTSVGAGANIIKYNPATGKYESVYQAPAEHSAAYKEYQDAVAGGYTGSFNQYQNEDANRKRPITNISVGGIADPQVKGWVDAIQSNKAKLSDVPAALKTAVAGALGNNTEATELQKNAYTSAQDLLSKFQAGNKFAVGKSSIFGTFPGTAARDFKTRFDNLKSLLSLDNVKYLKGQGQVSDAERKLLADASGNLSLSQSESEFEKSLKDVITVLDKVFAGGTAASSSTGGGNQFVGPSGTTYKLPY